MTLHQQHANNKAILEKDGFIIKNYSNGQILILEAYHKDGRKVSIRV